jgi:hypothetical protein
MPLSSAELSKCCAEILHRHWQTTLERESKGALPAAIPQDLAAAIASSVNSARKTYRYVLPTQLLAKVADPSLDCRCLQANRGGEGCFDARSLCHEVIVPFERVNENVLGGSSEPYANNPVRVPEVSEAYRSAQRDKEGWDGLCRVLAAAEAHQDASFTDTLFDHVLVEVYRRLQSVTVTYPVPQRVSHARLLPAMRSYLAHRSGGIRLQAVVASLFRTIGKRFSLFSDVRSNKPTASDASTGQVADVECYDPEGRIALAVEVKDRELTVTQVSDKLPAARSARVTELLFIVHKGVSGEEEEAMTDLVDRSFASGHNIYVFPLEDFASGLLALLGESGRREFLVNVGVELERYQAPLSDRRAWSALLKDL